jgi:hypothetical protein
MRTDALTGGLVHPQHGSVGADLDKRMARALGGALNGDETSDLRLS